MKQVVAIFGEAEKGDFRVPHVLRELPRLFDLLGNPPTESQGISFAIQTLLYNRELIFFRVTDEGFGYADYFNGFKLLRERGKPPSALCLPGVGDPSILAASEAISALLITNQQDLYDYLTSG